MSADHDEPTERFPKLKGAEYDRVNEFLREHSYLTAREWAVLRVSQDLRADGTVPTKRVGEELPDVVPFIDREFERQNVQRCRDNAYDKVVKGGAMFFYAAASGAFSPDEIEDLEHDIRERVTFLFEIEGGDIDVESEIDADRRVRQLMQEVREAAQAVDMEE